MISNQFKKLYRKVDRASGGRIEILKRTLTTFSNARASQAAAGLAYYAIFSLFPLLLILIAGGSFFLNKEQVYKTVTQMVQSVIPVSFDLIGKNLQQVLDKRGTFGIIGLLTLFWSASGFFTNLAYNINLAWPEASKRNFFEKRLVGLLMVVVLSGLLLFSLAFDWVTSLIPFLAKIRAITWSQGLLATFSHLGSWLMIFLLFLSLYRWTPTVKVRWMATIWSAITVSALWKIATVGFSWYLESGLGRYQLVYGSLGVIVALLVLIFIDCTLALFGAHLSAAIDEWGNGGANVRTKGD